MDKDLDLAKDVAKELMGYTYLVLLVITTPIWILPYLIWEKYSKRIK